MCVEFSHLLLLSYKTINRLLTIFRKLFAFFAYFHFVKLKKLSALKRILNFFYMLDFISPIQHCLM